WVQVDREALATVHLGLRATAVQRAPASGKHRARMWDRIYFRTCQAVIARLVSMRHEFWGVGEWVDSPQYRGVVGREWRPRMLGISYTGCVATLEKRRLIA